jgi:outer membrane protein assembly factor BamB
MIRKIALLTLAAFAAAGLPAAPKRTPTPVAQAAWPTFKGDNARTGRAASRLSMPIQVKWRVHLRKSLYSSPVVADGRVYVGSSSKRVYCLELESGKILWEKEIPARIWGSTPTVDQGRVFVGAVDGCIYSLDAVSGEIVSTYCAKNPDFLGNADVLSSPLIEGGRLVFGSDNDDIYGWDLNGQMPLWRFTTGDILHDNSASALSGTAYMASRDGHAYALDLTTGALRWKSAQIAKPYNTTPSLDGERAYLSGSDGDLHVLSLLDGHELWSFHTGRIMMSSPSFDGKGKLVFGSGDKCVYALNASDGSQVWKFKTGDGVLSSPLITGNLVWIGSYDEKVYVLDLATGQEVWSVDLDGGVFTSPACVGNLVLAAGREGELACFEAAYAPSVPFAPSVTGK